MSQEHFPVLAEVSAPNDGLEKALKSYFTIQRKSGGGDCHLVSLTSTSFRVSFNQREAQRRVLQQQKHVVKINSDEFHVTVRRIDDADTTSSGESIQCQEPKDAAGNMTAESGAAEGAIPKQRGSARSGAYSERRGSSVESRGPVKEITVDPSFGEYLKEREDVLTDFQRELLGAQCKVQLCKASDTLCLLPTVGHFPGEASTEWCDGAERAFQQMQGKYLVHCETDPAKMQLAMERCKGALKSLSIFKATQPGCTAVVGLREEVDLFATFIAERIEPAEEPQTEVTLQSLLKFSLIRGSFEEHLETRYPGLTWSLDEACSSISFAGSPGEVRDAAASLRDRMNRVLEETLLLSDQKMAFLSLWAPQEMATELFSFPIVLELGDHRVVLFGKSWPDLDRAKSILTNKISEEVISVQDEALATTHAKEWHDLLRPFLNPSSKRLLVHEVKGTNGVTSMVNVAGFREEVNQVVSKVKEYLDNSAVIEETIVPRRQVPVELIHELMVLMNCRNFQSHITTRAKRAIVLKGPRSILAAEKVRLESCLASIAWESLTIAEPGAKEFFQGRGKEHLDTVARDSKCLVVLQEDILASEAEHLLASPGSLVLATYRSEGGLVISVCQGDITQQQVDVIVNAANGRLRHGGGVAKAICKVGGPEIQRQSLDFVAKFGAVPVGQAAMTGAGRLPCAKVIHAVGPEWKLKEIHGQGHVVDLLRSSVSASLELAEQDGHRSIAIPCLSSGIFGVPKAVCADAIVSAIKRFSGSALKFITLIDINADVLSELQRACGEAWASPARSSPPGPGARPPTPPPDTSPPATTLRLEIISGPVEEQESDVLVAPISHDWNMHSTAASIAIIAKSLTAESSFKQGRIVYPGVVKQYDVTRDPDLKCRFVYFFVCSRWTESRYQDEQVTGSQYQDEQSLRLGIRTCLEVCHEATLSSITFPLGGMAFPKDVAAKALLGEVQRFQTKNQLTSIKTVKIAVLPNDHSGEATLREIQQQHQQMQADMMGGRSPGAFSHSLSTSGDLVRVTFGDIILQIACGDITKEATDVIVNSTGNHPPRLGVSQAICDAAGLHLQQDFCKADFSNGKCHKTAPGKLKCKAILHACGNDDPELIQKVVKNVLHKCAMSGWKSVSFPAFGTGKGILKPDIFAEAMIDAIASVAREHKHSPTLVRLVRIVILDSSIFNIFTASLANRLGAGSSPANHLKESTNTAQGREETSHIPEKQESNDAVQPAVINVFGRDEQSVREAVSHLQRVRNANFQEEDATYAFPAKLTASEIQGLLQLSQQHGVHVTVERAWVRARGEVGKVKGALASARRVLEDAARREQEELLTTARWFFIRGGKELPFDPKANVQLERGHDHKLPRIDVTTLGHTFLIDLNLKEAEVKEINEKVKIKRTDVRAVRRPSGHWEDMKGKAMMKFSLDKDSEEFQSVANKFNERSGQQAIKIITIDRIQNNNLRDAYLARRLVMADEQNGHEKILYHTTNRSDSMDISKHGFSRRSNSVNGFRYGEGVYFTEKPWNPFFARPPPDINGHQYVYQGPVLVGRWDLGRPRMKAPPPRSHNNPNDRFDSLVDDTTAPSTFVIFQSNQAYPAYLITYK